MAHLTVRKIGRKVIGANEERETPPAEPSTHRLGLYW